jgi:hypothetical protein
MTPGQHPQNFFEALIQSGWHHTQYESKHAVLANREKVHYVITYSRRDSLNEVKSIHTNLWIVICIGESWKFSLRAYQAIKQHTTFSFLEISIQTFDCYPSCIESV